MLQPIRFDIARFLAVNRYGDAADLTRVPEAYRVPLRDYLAGGVMPPAPLRLLLEGNVMAVRLFDDLPGFRALVEWLHDELPAPCWGSPDQVQLWVVFARRAVALRELALMDELAARRGEDAA